MTDTPKLPITAAELMALRDELHGNAVARGWWSNLTTGNREERNFGELLMLENTELTEARDGYLGNLMDDKLPHRPMIEVELADYVIRALDRSGGFNIDVGRNWVAGWAAVEKNFPQGTESALLELHASTSRTMEAWRKSDTAAVAIHTRNAIAGALIIGIDLNLDVLGALREKVEFNKVRADHDPANRVRDGGKKV